MKLTIDEGGTAADVLDFLHRNRLALGLDFVLQGQTLNPNVPDRRLTLWYDSFLAWFVECEGDEDLICFVRAGGEVKVHRRQSRVLPLIGNIDWPQTFLLNAICMQTYTLRVSILLRLRSGRLQVLQQLCSPVYAGFMLEEQCVYPKIIFPGDHSTSLLLGPGQLFCVELLHGDANSEHSRISSDEHANISNGVHSHSANDEHSRSANGGHSSGEHGRNVNGSNTNTIFEASPLFLFQGVIDHSALIKAHRARTSIVDAFLRRRTCVLMSGPSGRSNATVKLFKTSDLQLDCIMSHISVDSKELMKDLLAQSQSKTKSH